MRRLFIIITITVFQLAAIAQKGESIYAKQWQDIDSLIVLKNLPKSALEKVNALFADAKSKGVRDEMIKALLYKLDLEQQTQDVDINNDAALLKREIKTTNDVVLKSVLQVLLARRLNTWYDRNFWRSYDRKETGSYKDTDITTWSNSQLVTTIDSLFAKALAAGETLKKIGTVEFTAPLTKGNTPGTRPTLYDLLAHEALDYFQSGVPYIIEPRYAFELNDPIALAKSTDFIHHQFYSGDSASHLLQILRLYQDLMKFHLNDTDPIAFIELNIERITWVYSAISFETKDSLYQAALEDITDRFPNVPAAAEAWYLLANLYATNAASYRPFTDTVSRYDYAKAKQLIEYRLNAMPDSCFGNDEMKSLLAQINNPELSTVSESVNLANTPFRMLVKYKNIDTVYARVLLQKDVDAAESKQNYDRWKEIALLNPIKTFKQFLPRTNDYQQHLVEIKIDPFSPGDYAILFSNKETFDAVTDNLSLQPFKVSNLAFMRNESDYFVVDRLTGQPLEDVKMTGVVNTRGEKDTSFTMYSDNVGRVVIPAEIEKKATNGEIDLNFEKGNDVLETSDYFSSQNSYNNSYTQEDDSDYEYDNSRVYLFTDRSIYRLGQTVFYKGIVITEDPKTRKYKLFHYPYSVEVSLKDVTGRVIDSMFVTLNDYCSFSGKFVLPSSALTGAFTIEVWRFQGRTNFSVEDYKRPTFYIDFDTLKSSYRLNDTITVSGYAKAYAGNAVDHATVTYRIERTATFPYYWLFWSKRQPYSAPAEIADSIIGVDGNGKFEIKFLAAPDASIDKSTEPFFNFNIEVSITDANGETREAENNINAGYKSLILQLGSVDVADVSKFKNLYVTTKNNAGKNVPALVKITVTPLQNPAKPYNKRLWWRPDQFVMDEKIFSTFFPYDEYRNETDFREWKKLDAVITDTFNTGTTSDYKLTENLSQGWYYIEASTKDKDDNEVKDIRYVQLYDMSETRLVSGQVNFCQSLISTVQTGEKAQMLMGTSLEKVFVVEKISRGNGHLDSLAYIRLDNNTEKLKYTIHADDNNNVGLYYAFVKHNRFYTGGMLVHRADKKDKLNISYASYRNKTEPGSKETWTVHITNDKNERVNAELLTGMYDKSLDQFKNHMWETPNQYETDHMSNEWNSDWFNAYFSSGNELSFLKFYGHKHYDRLEKTATAFWNLYEFKKMDVSVLESKFKFPNAPRDYIKVYGIVKDAKEDEPIPWGTVIGNGTHIGTTTDAWGVFGIAVPPNTRTLVVSAVGFVETEVNVSPGILNVSLQRSQNTVTDAVVTTALGIYRSGTSIRGISSLNADAITVVDGDITDQNIKDIPADKIESIAVLQPGEAIALYGPDAANGAIVITTREFALRNGKKKEQQQIRIRKNLNETAFFFPQLHADSAGNYNFSFIMPEALTQWKWMSLAHTKDFAFGLKEQSIATQKTLMVHPNLPRFLREGDTIALTARISNLSDSILRGTASLQLFDAITDQPLNNSFGIDPGETNFSVEADQTSVIKFPLKLPLYYTQPVTVKIIARADSFSDGEENTLPVLPNRVLVTETFPLNMQGAGTKEFSFDKLFNMHSKTLSNEALTVEYTPNPIWYALQSLPYLMQFPYECAEQTFNRFYANALATQLISQYPETRRVFEKWIKDSLALKSNLEQSPELKNVLLSETPWVNDAENEARQRRNIALFFDSVQMSKSIESALQQLTQMQLANGAFPWFKGGLADRYITQYVLTGIAKLKKLNAIPEKQASVVSYIVDKGLQYLDKQILADYNHLIKFKADLTKNHLSQIEIQYWYMRSFFPNENIATFPSEVLKFSQAQAEQFWMKQSPYMQAMLAISLHHIFPAMKPEGKLKSLQLDILRSLKENAVTDSAKGMYWKSNLNGYYWYESPIEAQAMLIGAFKEITPLDPAINEMVRWLVSNKQTNSWPTTTATADACYALLSTTDAKEKNVSVRIAVGDSVVSTSTEEAQAGTGYIKHRFDGKNVEPAMGKISVTILNAANKSESTPGSYGAVYWQYFEDIDKITPSTSPLSISKKLFIEKNSDKGKILQPVNNSDVLKVGDKIIIRLVLKSDRDMEYIHLKDMRASSMEPVNVLSEYKWQDNLGYYESTRDAGTNFFIDHLRKGTYVIEYPVYVTHAGNFSSGIATIQCLYAPQFSAHSEGLRINVTPSIR